MVEDIREMMDSLVYQYEALLEEASYIENNGVRKKLILLFEREKARVRRLEEYIEDGDAG